MKRLIIAIVMLIFAVTVASTASIILDKNVKSIITDIQDLQNSLDKNDIQQTKAQTEAILKKWIKAEKTLKLIAMQDKILPLTEKFNHLANSYSSDVNELNKNLKEISVMLEIFISTERAVFENIF